MTPAEAKLFFDELFIAFPHLKAYLAGVESPQGTFDAWKRLLSQADANDAQAALSRVLDGYIEVPTKPWDIGVLGNWARSIIGRVTDDRRKRERQASTQRMSDESKRIKGNGKRISFGQACRIASAAGMCLSRGEISKARNAEIVEYAKHMQTHHDGDEMEVPDDIRHEYEHPTTKVFSRP